MAGVLWPNAEVPDSAHTYSYRNCRNSTYRYFLTSPQMPTDIHFSPVLRLTQKFHARIQQRRLRSRAQTQPTASLTDFPIRLSISTSVSIVNLEVFLFTTSDTRGRDTIRISAASACLR